MKHIYILRSAPYNYQIENCDLYDSFNLVAQRRVEPEIRKGARVFFTKHSKSLLKQRLDYVYCSPRLRSKMTAQLLCKSPIILNELHEILFGMDDFISRSAFYTNNNQPNINLARKLFVKALINNQLQESYQSIIKRAQRIERLLQQMKPGKTMVLFSHGFFMKVFKSYLKDKRIKHNPQLLLIYFDGKTETFNFCEGYTVHEN